MATYTLSGQGTQTLSASVTALHVTISTIPTGSGHGDSNPTDYWGVGSLRPGNATAFWEPFIVCGGPQWLPVPFGTTRLGYSFASGAVVSVVEVFAAYPLAVPLSAAPDVALSSVADAQVLAYQASSSKWINATPTGGGSTPTFVGARVYRTTTQSVSSGAGTYVSFTNVDFDTSSMSNIASTPTRLTCKSAGKYLIVGACQIGSSTSGERILGFVKNGTVGYRLVQDRANNNNMMNGSLVTALVLNDYFELQVYQDSGSTLNICPNAVESYLAMAKLD